MRSLVLIIMLAFAGKANAEPADLWLREITSNMGLYHWEDVDQDWGTPINSPTLIISNSILTMLPSTRGPVNMGISATFHTFGPSAVACDGAHTNTMRGTNAGHMMWCDGSVWVDVTDTMDTNVNNIASLNSRVTGISNTLTSAQLTLAGKYNTPAGTTAQYVRGDGSLAAFPAIPAAQVNSDWNASSGLAQILNKPSLAVVATTGAYTDLTGTPNLALYETVSAHNTDVTSLTTAVNGKAAVSHTHSIAQITGLQTALDAKQASLGTSATTTYLRGDQTWQALPTVTLISNTTTLTNPRVVLKSGATSGGTAVFYLTNDNTAGGTALLTNIAGVDVDVNASGNSYPTSWALSNSNRTLTVTVNQTGSLLGLGLVPFVSAANGIAVNVRVFGN